MFIIHPHLDISYTCLCVYVIPGLDQIVFPIPLGWLYNIMLFVYSELNKSVANNSSALNVTNNTHMYKDIFLNKNINMESTLEQY